MNFAQELSRIVLLECWKWFWGVWVGAMWIEYHWWVRVFFCSVSSRSSFFLIDSLRFSYLGLMCILYACNEFFFPTPHLPCTSDETRSSQTSRPGWWHQRYAINSSLSGHPQPQMRIVEPHTEGNWPFTMEKERRKCQSGNGDSIWNKDGLNAVDSDGNRLIHWWILFCHFLHDHNFETDLD